MDRADYDDKIDQMLKDENTSVEEGLHSIPGEEDEFSTATHHVDRPAPQCCVVKTEKFSWQDSLTMDSPKSTS